MSNSENVDDQRVTLLIPTFNRSHFLERQLDYLSRHFSPETYKTIILDGSNDESMKIENAVLAERYAVEYGWYDSSAVAGYQRMILGCELVTTDYLQMVPDDDYFSEPVMKKHIKILDENPDAVGVFGHSVSFQISNKSVPHS